MKPRWEMLTGWKVNLETDEKSFEYFNKESLIPGHIYRVHVRNGVPMIIEFKQFGYRYDPTMTKLYPCMLICNKTPDILIDDITHIFVCNIDDDEDVSSESDESTKTTDVSGFKDFVVSNKSYHVNEKLNGVETVSRLSTDKMHISGELKITGIDIIVDNYPCSSSQSMRVKLPTGDEITIPASDHPWVENSEGQNFPVFIEDESELKWHKGLAAGEFYIMLNEFGDKKPILIKNIYTDKIEYVSWYSRYDRNNLTYFVEGIAYEPKIEDVKDRKFIAIRNITC